MTADEFPAIPGNDRLEEAKDINDELHEGIDLNDGKNERMLKVWERFFWFLLSLLLSSWPIVLVAKEKKTIDFLLTNPIPIVLPILTLSVPYLYFLVFSEYPIQHLRKAIRLKAGTSEALNLINKSEIKYSGVSFSKEENSENSAKKVYDAERSDSMSKYIPRYRRQSEGISERIYQRAGVYLLAGYVIAFLGVMLFYFQANAINTLATTNTQAQLIKDLKLQQSIDKSLVEYIPRLRT